MYLSFETNELSALDLKIIQLVGNEATPVAPGTTPPSAAAPSVVVPIKAVPAEEPVKDTAAEEAAKVEAKEAAKKAALAKKAEAEAAAKAKADEEAAAKAEETVEEDLVGGAEPEPEGPTMADAVAAATKLVSSGGAPKVKAALATVGAKRVSEVEADQIGAFIAALDAA